MSKKFFGKILCFFGFHDCYYTDPSRGMCGGTGCRRDTCTWNIPAIVWPEPPPRPQYSQNLWKPEQLKMYILIRDDTPADLVPLIAAHTSMGTYKKFKDRFVVQKWFETKLQKKVICKVTPEVFWKAKEQGDYFALTEVRHQELGELGLGFRVLPEYPKFFKFLPLYKVE
ncbi:MAG: hypothetical protein NTZ13_02050 [Candidatus Parcubacteria bacterium]|nr:hypothetical protein [Candidatus Parcubacteria bacterium]